MMAYVPVGGSATLIQMNNGRRDEEIKSSCFLDIVRIFSNSKWLRTCARWSPFKALKQRAIEGPSGGGRWQCYDDCAADDIPAIADEARSILIMGMSLAAYFAFLGAFLGPFSRLVGRASANCRRGLAVLGRVSWVRAAGCWT